MSEKETETLKAFVRGREDLPLDFRIEVCSRLGEIERALAAATLLAAESDRSLEYLRSQLASATAERARWERLTAEANTRFDTMMAETQPEIVTLRAQLAVEKERAEKAETSLLHVTRQRDVANLLPLALASDLRATGAVEALVDLRDIYTGIVRDKDYMISRRLAEEEHSKALAVGVALTTLLARLDSPGKGEGK